MLMNPRTRPRPFLLVSVLAGLALLVAACGDDGAAPATGDSAPDTAGAGETTKSTIAEPGTTAPIPGGGEALVDLQLSMVEFGDAGFVEIVNNADTDADLTGVNVCQFPNYKDLGDVLDSPVLAAGATVQIPAEHFGALDAAGGEVAIYDGSDFGSADSILSYVQWGSGDHTRAAAAVEAGIWPAADVFVTPDPAFPNIESGGFAADPESWS